MSDQSEAVAFTGQGQAGDPSQEEANAAQQQYLTRDDLDQIADGITEKVVRRTQGLIDSQTVNINKRIQEGLSSLSEVVAIQREAGLEITPEQEQALRQRVIAGAYTQNGDPPPPPGPSETTGQPKPEVSGEQVPDPVTAEAISMMEEAGVFITNDDPEAEKMRSAKTARQYFKAVEEAIVEKAKRTSAPPGGQDSSARSPTNLGGQGSKASLSRQYNDEVSKVRGDVWAVVQLKRKYRKMGLDI